MGTVDTASDSTVAAKVARQQAKTKALLTEKNAKLVEAVAALATREAELNAAREVLEAARSEAAETLRVEFATGKQLVVKALEIRVIVDFDEGGSGPEKEGHCSWTQVGIDSDPRRGSQVVLAGGTTSRGDLCPNHRQVVGREDGVVRLDGWPKRFLLAQGQFWAQPYHLSHLIEVPTLRYANNVQGLKGAICRSSQILLSLPSIATVSTDKLKLAFPKGLNSAPGSLRVAPSSN
ncbi:hypothetical protein V2J09_005996 [Rumex salicifolius]